MRKLHALLWLAFLIPALSSAATLSELQAQLAQLMQQLAAVQSQQGTTPTVTPLPTASTQCPALTHTLSRGMKGSDVTLLQQFLISQKLLATDSATGFYGALTEAAVKKFQCAQNIVCAGTPASTGYSTVGARTRSAITKLCNGKTVTITPGASYGQDSYGAGITSVAGSSGQTTDRTSSVYPGTGSSPTSSAILLAPVPHPPLAAIISSLTGLLSEGARALFVSDIYAHKIFTDANVVFGTSDAWHGTQVSDAPQSQALDCAAIPKDNIAVILSAGQSNGTNTTPPNELYTPKHKFYNYNVDDGKCYVAGATALGVTSNGSAFVLPLADNLIENGMYKTVLIAPVSIGGTFIEEWRPDGGRYFFRLEKAIQDLAMAGFKPTYMLWHQGEGNAAPLVTQRTIGLHGSSVSNRSISVTHDLKDATAAAYQKYFYAIVARMRDLGLDAPVFPAVATTCGYPTISQSIRAAQQKLPNAEWGIYQGPDSDMLDYSARYDSCHFGLRGIVLHARYWAHVLEAFSSAVKKPTAPPPLCLLSFAPEIIEPGQNAGLYWSSYNTIAASLDNGLGGSLSLSGSTVVSGKTENKTYHMTVTGKDGSTSQCVATVVVRPTMGPEESVESAPPGSPTCSLSFSPTTGPIGAGAGLYWSSYNTIAASLDNGLGGSLSLSGSTVITIPESPKTYTLTVMGTDGSTKQCQATISPS